MRGTVTGFHRSFGFVNIKYVAYYYIYIYVPMKARLASATWIRTIQSGL